MRSARRMGFRALVLALAFVASWGTSAPAQVPEGIPEICDIVNNGFNARGCQGSRVYGAYQGNHLGRCGAGTPTFGRWDALQPLMGDPSRCILNIPADRTGRSMWSMRANDGFVAGCYQSGRDVVFRNYNNPNTWLNPPGSRHGPFSVSARELNQFVNLGYGVEPTCDPCQTRLRYGAGMRGSHVFMSNGMPLIVRPDGVIELPVLGGPPPEPPPPPATRPTTRPTRPTRPGMRPGRADVRCVNTMAGGTFFVVMSCDNTHEGIQASGNYFRTEVWGEDSCAMQADAWVGENINPALEYVTESGPFRTVMDPVECAFGLCRFRIGDNGLQYTGGFQRPNGQGCYEGLSLPWNPDAEWWFGLDNPFAPRRGADACTGGNNQRVDPPYEGGETVTQANAGGGCGCDAGGRDGASWWGALILALLALLPAAWRRRRAA